MYVCSILKTVKNEIPILPNPILFVWRGAWVTDDFDAIEVYCIVKRGERGYMARSQMTTEMAEDRKHWHAKPAHYEVYLWADR